MEQVTNPLAAKSSASFKSCLVPTIEPLTVILFKTTSKIGVSKLPLGSPTQLTNPLLLAKSIESRKASFSVARPILKVY